MDTNAEKSNSEKSKEPTDAELVPKAIKSLKVEALFSSLDNAIEVFDESPAKVTLKQYVKIARMFSHEARDASAFSKTIERRVKSFETKVGDSIESGLDDLLKKFRSGTYFT